ncbi:MAG: hypothetical protein M3O34_15625 [Chloroflexota bacterium]|nr:hypothetical protein [Chloroflexota bacterium]
MASDQPDPRQWKIFPRNLTARADFVVRGNPTSSRPESGVDNCYPGLEFDQRNLDKAFFPGLVFEFHRQDGAILHRVEPGGAPAREGLSNDDLPLFLWAMIGRTTAEQSDADPPVFFLHGLAGLDVWRRVHDLLPGRIAVLLGPAPGFDALPPSPGVIRLLDQLRDENRSVVQRNPDGSINFVVLVGDRARYLDDDGVIEVDAYEPGDLTRSLCAPWQFDFRDCGCFYWAANKPDLVSNADGTAPYLNFQRRDRTAIPTPDQVLAQWRREQELDYGELIAGAWNELPVVVDDQESLHAVPPPAPPVPTLMTPAEVAAELRYLATVEHALCVEYLYAHYSLNAPMSLPPQAADQAIAGPRPLAGLRDMMDAAAAAIEPETRRIFAAAFEVFTIAVDEMRHFRWVNEALNLLGEAPSTGRADRIGRALDRPFALEPLTPEQLDWFIQVEEPSQSIEEGLDGMYVRLHTSIDRQRDLFPEAERLVNLMKLIIDEGGDHYTRFLAVKEHLKGLDATVYLRPLADPPAGLGLIQALQDLSDQNYRVLIDSLQVTFGLGDRAAGILIEQSRRAMFSLHETNHLLASNGGRPRFALVPPPPSGMLDTAASAESLVDNLDASTREALAAVANAGGTMVQAVAARQQQAYDDLFTRMRQVIREERGP